MLYILFSWLNATFLAYTYGKSFVYIITRNQIKNQFTFSVTLILGLVGLSIIVSLWAIFGPTNLLMQIFIELGGVIFFFILLKKKVVSFQTIKITFSWLNLVLISVFAYLFVYVWIKCYSPTSHYDEGLYYIQHIRWLQQFGFVKGLANLHHRLGFNSNWQDLAAFFDYPFTGYLFNDLNGLLFLFFTGYAFTGIKSISEKDYSFSNFLKILSWLSLVYPHPDMVSIRSYIFINTITADWASFIYVTISLITFLEYHEKPHEEKPYYALMAVLFSLYSFSVKVANVSILLIPLYFLIFYAIKKDYKQTFNLFTYSTALLLPWIIGNIILSGYLVFPITQTQLSFLDWAVPQDYLKSAIEFTKIWAKTVGKVDVYSKLDFVGSYTYWYKHQSPFIQNLYLFLLISWILLIGLVLFQLIKNRHRFLVTFGSHLYVITICLLGTLFWFFNAPDFRFSAVFILFGVFFLAAFIIRPLLLKAHYLYYFILLLCFYFFKPPINLSQIAESFKTYALPSVTQVVVAKQGNIFVPVSTDQCFDSTLPCTASYELDKGIIIMKDSINLNEGFYLKK